MIRRLIVAATLTAAGILPSLAADLFWRAARDCPSFAIQPSTSGGSALTVLLKAGEVYEVVREPSARSGLMLIKVPDLARTRAVYAECGEFVGDRDDVGKGVPGAEANIRLRDVDLLPVFDDETESPRDPVPQAPVLEPFDLALLDLCGRWGDQPGEEQFERLLRRPAAADVRDDLRLALKNQLDGTRYGGDDNLFKAVARVWFRRNALRHVFCGDPKADRLAGLHWAGRLLQAQDNRWIWRTKTPDQRIDPPVYTVGLLYRTPDGQVCSKCEASYVLDWSARDLLVQATLAYDALRRQGQFNATCLVPFEPESDEVSGDPFALVVVIADRALVTAYPVADTRDFRCTDGNCGCQRIKRSRCDSQCYTPD